MQFVGLQLTIAKSGLLEFFTQSVKSLTGFIQSLSKTNPELLKLGTVIAGVAAVAGPALWMIGGMATGLGTLATGVSLLKLAAIKTFPFLVTGFTAIAGTVTKLSAVLLANPLVAAAAGLAAAVYVIYDNWDGIVNWFSKTFDEIKSAFSDGLLKGMFTAFEKLNPFNLMFEAIDGLVAYMTGFDLSGMLTQQLQSAIGGLPDWAKDLIGVRDMSHAAPERPVAPSDPRIAGIIQNRHGAPNNSRATVDVNFNGMPTGTRVESKSEGDGLDLAVGQGYTLQRVM